MRPVIAKNLSPKNINIALLRSEDVKSDSVLQIRDLSIETTENQLAIFTEARRSTVDNLGVLEIQNDTFGAEITSEYNFIQDTAEYVPLWLKHKFQLSLYNNTGVKRSIEIKSATLDTEFKFIPLRDEAIIVENTIVVRQKVGGEILPKSSYIVDLGKRTIKIVTPVYGGDNIVVSFYVINNTIDIFDEDGNKIERRFFRIQPSKYITDSTPGATDQFPPTDSYLDHTYDVDILFANVLDFDRTYFLTYSIYDTSTNSIDNREEVINIENLYTKVDALQPYHSGKSLVYSINEDTFDIKTTLTENWPIVFVKYPTDRNSKVSLVEPVGVAHDSPWFIEISNDKFVKDSYTYRPIERLEQNIINGSYSVNEAIENVNKITPDTIKLNHNNIILNYNNSGNITNVTLVNSGIDISDKIQWIDSARGIVRLSSEVNIDQSDSSISYDYKTFNIQYRNTNINPYMFYNESNNNIIDKYIMLYMLPIEEVDINKGRSIFHIVVYKNPERYENIPDYSKSIEAAKEYILGTNQSNESNLYELIPEFLASSVPGELHPIILGYISATNITTPSSVRFEDIRRRGGGIVRADDINELYEDKIRHYLDIAPFNGYQYDLSNIKIVDIKKTIREDLIERMQAYDEYAVRQIKNNPSFNIGDYVDQFILKVVRKHSNAAADITIRYID